MSDFRSSRRALRETALAVALASCGACSWALNWDKASCSSLADCESLGADFEGTTCIEGRCKWAMSPVAGQSGAAGAAGANGADEPWACLGNVAGGASTGAGTTTIVGHVKSLQEAAVVGATVRACTLFVDDCNVPVAGPALSDETGTFELLVPSSFSGYLEVNAEGYVPGLLSPVVADAAGQVGDFDLLDIALGTRILDYMNTVYGSEDQLDDIVGIYARALDCTGATTAGVSFRLERPGESELVYFKNDSFDFAATQTSAKGGALFLFVDPGVNAVVAKRVEGDVEIDRLGVATRRGYLTTVVMGPLHRTF